MLALHGGTGTALLKCPLENSVPDFQRMQW